jgi:hypothetical protein
VWTELIRSRMVGGSPRSNLVAGGKPVTGHDGIRDAFNVFLSSGARMKLDTRAVIESGEGLAVLHGEW